MFKRLLDNNLIVKQEDGYTINVDEANILLEKQLLEMQQQLKDKNEKISKIKDYCLIEREDINGSKCDDILEILESNKED